MWAELAVGFWFYVWLGGLLTMVGVLTVVGLRVPCRAMQRARAVVRSIRR